MDYEGPTPEAWWQAELDAIAPPGGKLSWLKLVWVPGDEWEPVGRWIIHQMMPIDRTPAMVRNDLLGPSPRVRGRYDQVLGRFLPDPLCNVSYQQWQLFQDTRCWARPYWIVQGTGGGHKRSFNRTESVVSRMNGGPKDTPLAGDLPFANPDARTFAMLARLDLMRSYSYLLDRQYANPDLFDAHDKRIMDDMRTQVWQWLRGQVQDVLSDEKAGAKAIWESGVNERFIRNEAALEAAYAEG